MNDNSQRSASSDATSELPTPTRNRRDWWCVLIILLAPFPTLLLAQDEVDPRLKQVLADWQKRRAYPVVRYEVEGKTITTKEAIERASKGNRKPVFEPKDFHLEWNVRLVLDVKRQRHRYETESDSVNISTGKVTRKAGIGAFDGSALTTSGRDVIEGKRVKPKPTTPDVTVITGNLANTGFPAQLVPLFAGHGVVVFPPEYEIIAGKLDHDPDTSLMTVHGTDVFEGRRCVLLRSHPGDGNSFQEFWIDPERDSALVRRLVYSADFPIFETNVRYQQSGTCWLVKSWTYETRGWLAEEKRSVTTAVYRFTVVKATLEDNVADSEFRLPIEPGMLVKRIHNEADKNPLKKEGQGTPEHYRIDPSGKEVEIYFDKGIERRRWDPIFWWLPATIAALMFVGYLGWRIRKGKSASISRPQDL